LAKWGENPTFETNFYPAIPDFLVSAEEKLHPAFAIK